MDGWRNFHRGNSDRSIFRRIPFDHRTFHHRTFRRHLRWNFDSGHFTTEIYPPDFSPIGILISDISSRNIYHRTFHRTRKRNFRRRTFHSISKKEFSPQDFSSPKKLLLNCNFICIGWFEFSRQKSDSEAPLWFSHKLIK